MSLRAKPLPAGYELVLRAELTEGKERQVLEERVRVDAALELLELERTGEVFTEGEPAERFEVRLKVADGQAQVERREGAGEPTTQSVPWTRGTLCGLTARLLLPARLPRTTEPASLEALDLESLEPEALEARWSERAEGAARLSVGSREIADPWTYDLNASGSLQDVRTGDGLRWTLEPDEAAARRDVTWPADDPRHVVLAFLHGVEEGQAAQVEGAVDWARLAASLGEEDPDALREKVIAALGDAHVEDPLSEAELELREAGEERLVTTEGLSFRLARTEGGWRIVGIEGE
ncbi:MAG: hypothetical protein R3F62_03000 [Planctomycetota bacterium]